MRRAGELIGLPVITRTKGEILGEVDDILFDNNDGELKYIVIKNREKYYTAVENLYKIGKDLVIIENHVGLSSDSPKNNYTSLNNDNNTLLGEQVVTSDGKDVGSIKDFVIDENAYRMAGYEISGGIFNDIMNGRNILAIDEDIVKGKDAVILENNNMKEI